MPVQRFSPNCFVRLPQIACALLALVLALGLAGCAARSKTAPAPGSAAGQPPLRVEPQEVPLGKVVSVNVPLRFAVIDFSLRPLPPIGHWMALYREGQKVGEIRITGPSLNGNIVADLTAGTAQAGDEARVE